MRVHSNFESNYFMQSLALVSFKIRNFVIGGLVGKREWVIYK